MSRLHLAALVLVPALSLATAVARAEEPKPAVELPKELATNEDAKAAVAKFREEFKGRDVEKKADAIDGLAKVQHPDVVAELAKLLNHRDKELRAVATQDLANMTAIPAIAGAKLAATIEANATDWSYLADVVDTVKTLKYRGALPHLVKLFKNPNSAVVRWALDAIGDMKDVRALDAVLDLMKETKVDSGVSWEGGEVKVDTGTAGDGDQKAAEAAYRAKYGDGKGKGKSSGRKMRSLGEILFLVVKDLTGQQFATEKSAREWVEAHKAELDVKKKVFEDEQKAQEASAAAVLAAVRAAK
jgi:hypothetical protein